MIDDFRWKPCLLEKIKWKAENLFGSFLITNTVLASVNVISFKVTVNLIEMKSFEMTHFLYILWSLIRSPEMIINDDPVTKLLTSSFRTFWNHLEFKCIRIYFLSKVDLEFVRNFFSEIAIIAIKSGKQFIANLELGVRP